MFTRWLSPWPRPVWCRLRGDERGAVSAELVIAVPVLMLLILVIAQFAIWEHAQHIAQSAASQALSAARIQGGSGTAGHVEADNVLRQLGSGPLHDPQATVHRGPNESIVDVQGEASSVIPFLHLPVRARAVGPTERFTGSAG